MDRHNVLILGASYGSLFATKLLLAGHRAALVCTQATADLITRAGTVVRFPINAQFSPRPAGGEGSGVRREFLDVASKDLPGELIALTPEAADPTRFDLVVLAMQEAQYGSPGVYELMGRIARAKKPCLAIMNMPPLPYLKRIAGLRAEELECCYARPRIWDGFDPALVTLASPDPQAFRPANELKNILQVGLATNFKAARFDAEPPTALLRRLAADIDAARFRIGTEAAELPVKLKVHDSLFVPLAKWPMLIAGNYRCIRPGGMISIRDAVHGDLDKARAIYEWVGQVCVHLGAAASDLVPFEKYAQAAAGLAAPSSAARALFAGAAHIERVDCLVRRIAAQHGMQSADLDAMVAFIDERLAANQVSQVP